MRKGKHRGCRETSPFLGGKMIIIAGLGNPGKEYENTRHNAGFMVVDALAKKMNVDVTTYKHKALLGKGILAGQKVVLAKPQTFMNSSGESLRELFDYYKPNAEDEIIVIYDDITLDVGSIRVRKSGSAGGHNGMKSIIAHLGTQEFPRVRVGIGEKPARMDLKDWVLGHFPEAEKENLSKGIEDAAEAVEMLLKGEIDEAMNRFNRKVSRE